MTTNARGLAGVLPLLMRFAEPMENAVLRRLRYDPVRQVAQVEVKGRWVDAPDAHEEVHASTRMTKVQAETTDDE